MILGAGADDLDGGHGALELAAEVGALQVRPEPVDPSQKGEIEFRIISSIGLDTESICK